MSAILKIAASLITILLISCTIPEKSEPSVSPPIFSPSSPAVHKGTVIGMDCMTPDAMIYFTTDGSVPTKKTTLYDGSNKPIVNSPMIIKAIAIKEGLADSPVTERQYSIAVDLVSVYNEISAKAGFTLGIRQKNNYIYTALEDVGLRVYDVSFFSNPIFVNEYPLDAHHLELSGNYLYVSGNSNLYVFDVGNPLNLQLRCTVATQSYEATDFIIKDNYIYLVSDSHYIYVIDISDPPSSVFKYKFYTVNTNESIASMGNYLVTTDYAGLYVFDASNPLNLAFTGSGNEYSGYSNRKVLIDGTRALVIDGFCGCWVYDLSNPASPVLSGSYGMVYGWGIDLYKVDNYVYFSSTEMGLNIYDISFPPGPWDGSYFYDDYYAGKMCISRAKDFDYSNNTLFLACGSNGIAILDISNRVSPVLLSTIDTCSIVNCTFIENNKLYSGKQYRMDLYDVSDIEDPIKISSINLYSDLESIYVNNNHAFISESEGIEIIDFTNPVMPVSVAFLEGQFPGHVAVFNN